MRLSVPRKRWWLLAGATVAVVAVATAMTWPEPLKSRAKGIRPGMTPAEAEQVMGRPPEWSGEVGPKPAQDWDDEFWHPAATKYRVRHELWSTPAVLVYVFYIDGVFEVICYDRASDSLWDRIHDRLAF
ncbi:MAG TPA: hypothetical protein VM597_11025 [Gemmataceae bacterium]|jgi:hypothetical protein|nr:hypothetical protein [Gemmataceae bacterium]